MPHLQSGGAVLWLLVATALGALVALYAALSRKGRTEDQARAYLAGFTYVLSDDPDAAIAELSRVAELSSQTLETYFALAALFRRKGDLERAIRLHTNILLSRGLSTEVRRRAQLALARDYRQAGLRDEATATLERALREDPEHPEALLLLRQVYEDARAWARAAEVEARRVPRGSGGQEVLAHLLAAESRALVASHQVPEALAVAERAVALCEASADAQLALGEARLAAGQGPQAAGRLQAAVTLEPELAPRAVRLLRSALPPDVVERFLRERSGEAGEPFALALALLARQRGQVNEAIDQLKRLVERAPRLWEARRELGALLLEYDRSEEVRADYQEILGTLGQPALAFGCSACRQKVLEHQFRCPGCGAWDTVRRGPTAAH
nr:MULTISPECIES: tetratricopeptide repeat protein [Myxococcaceae]